MLEKYVTKKNKRDLRDEWLNIAENLVTKTINDNEIFKTSS